MSIPHTSSTALTRREKEVLYLLSLGMQQKQIADRLFISKETVKKHIRNSYEKLHATNKIEALRNCGIF
jgi:DNA-binding CsgD family transcriptional regulator